jgi:hypothetical protein
MDVLVLLLLVWIVGFGCGVMTFCLTRFRWVQRLLFSDTDERIRKLKQRRAKLLDEVLQLEVESLRLPRYGRDEIYFSIKILRGQILQVEEEIIRLNK